MADVAADTERLKNLLFESVSRSESVLSEEMNTRTQNLTFTFKEKLEAMRKEITEKNLAILA